jgi:hypothetical protein
LGDKHGCKLQEFSYTSDTRETRKAQWVESGFEQERVQFCLVGQGERIPAIISDVTDNLAQMSITVDREWLVRFIERHETELMAQKAAILGRSPHEVAPDNVKQYFNILREEHRSVPSRFVWNMRAKPS